MKIAAIRTLILASFLVISTPTLRSQGTEKPEDSSCHPGQGCDWLTAEAERIEVLSANDKSPTFSLTLSPGTRNKIISEYHVGDKMWLTIVVTNLTKHDTYCSLWSEDYEVFDEDGKPVEKRPRGTEREIYDCGLGAGGSVPDEFQLERVSKITRPGKYTIRVSRQEPFAKDEKGERPVVWSNPITITVLAADPAPDAAK
ncbi:MAG: hypothetical protein ABSC76_11930 [Terracidiphilus sp.]|jgi:hypothetical protein